MGQLKEKWKDLSDFIKISSVIIVCFGSIMTGMFRFYQKVDVFMKKFENTVNAAEQVSLNKTEIEKIKKEYTPLTMHDEHTKYIITQIDLEIDETMERVSEKKYVGTRYANTLKYYYDSFSFLTSKQRSMIDVILKYYERQELRNINIKEETEYVK